MAKLNQRPGQQRVFRQRITTLFSLIALMLMLLLLRIGHMQIIKAGEYEARSEQNRVRLFPIEANRGEIFDRNFKVKLIANRKSLCLTAIPAAMPKEQEERGQLVERLSVMLDMETNLITRLIDKDSWDRYSPKLIKEGLDFETLTLIAENSDLYPGIYWENRPIRVYTLSNTLAHILGYTGYVSAEELKSPTGRGFRPGALIGKTGIEHIYDSDLRGSEGTLEREVNALNHVTRQVVRKEPVHGRPLALTIDSRLQEVAQAAMGKMRGAVIVTRPATGEVLAILSNPGYPANLFYQRLEIEDYRKIESDPEKPLFNRAIQAQYPASSTFKLITSIAGLESKQLKPETSYLCEGGYQLGDRYFRCWYGRHEKQFLIDAIMNSCNVFFYRAGLEIGADTIFHYARMFGFGKKSGIDLVGEATGFVPTREWKRKSSERPWLDGDTLNLAIGQGDLLVTPIQVNLMTCAIFNEGVAFKPYLKKEVRSLYNNQVIERNEGRQIAFTTDVKQESFAIVKKGMIAVVNGGTGSAAASPHYQVAGKTGTAEATQGLTHAWFTGFAPAEPKNPEETIAVTVVCENAGGGGAMAAPVAACIIRSHFEGKTINETMHDIWKSYENNPE